MVTTAQLYNISQTELDAMCNYIKVYPVPDYERFFTNLKGELYMIQFNSNNLAVLEKITPNYVESNGVCEYSIANLNDEIEHITNVQLCARTFYGYFPEEFIYLKDDIFNNSSSIRYDLGNIDCITENLLSIHGILFKRIYYKGEIKTNFFISQEGVVYNGLKNRILAHVFQHNMYHRHAIVTEKYIQKRIGTHRLVFNVWNNNGVWLPKEIQVNHIDGLKYHNYSTNLEKSTQLENMRHAKINGLKKMPYSEDFIRSLCELIQSNQYDIPEMRNKMGIPDEAKIAFKSLVYSLTRKNSWMDITSSYDFSQYLSQEHSRKSLQIAEAICKEYVESGYDKKSVIRKFPEISKSYIDSICRGYRFPEVAAKYGLPRDNIHWNAMSRSNFKEARVMIAEGKSINEVASHFGVNEKVIKNMIYTDACKARNNKEGSTTIESISI